jgi:hypothetical protein
MTWLVESPWPAVTLGVVLEVALAIVLVRTGRGAVLIAMGLVLLLTAGMVALEWTVVTETEQIEGLLHAAATALEANDPPRVLALFSPDSPRRAEIESVLGRYTVRDVHIGRVLEIVTNRLTNPPSARAYFVGRVSGTDSRGTVPYQNMIQRFRVTLHRDGERWLIHDYTMEDPRSGG